MSRGRVEDQCVTDGGEFFLLPVFCFFVLFWGFFWGGGWHNKETIRYLSQELLMQIPKMFL